MKIKAGQIRVLSSSFSSLMTGELSVQYILILDVSTNVYIPGNGNPEYSTFVLGNRIFEFNTAALEQHSALVSE